MRNRTTSLSQSVRTDRAKRPPCALGFIALAMLADAATAGLVASNASVPAVMNAGGTAGDVALYLYEGAYSGSLSSMTVGNTTAHNRFDVTAASVCTVTGTANIGNTGSTGNNTVRVTGAGSKMTVGTLYVGNQSYDNALIVDEGAIIVASGNHYLGIAAGGGRNSLTFNNSTYTGSATRVYLTGSFSNSLTIAGSSRVYLRGIYIGTDSSVANAALIDGEGTRVITSQSIWVGSDTTSNSNTLTIANGALAQTDYATSHSAYCFKTGTSTNNFLRLAGGYAASKGRPDYLLASRILVWDGASKSWVQGVQGENYTRTQYATEELALAATGYGGLANYYIFAGGDPLTPPPAPTTVLLVR